VFPDYQGILFINPQIFGAHKLHLLIDQQRTNDEPDGNEELPDYQALS